MRSRKLIGGCAALVLALFGPAAGAQTITEIIDAVGDGTHGLDAPRSIAVHLAVEGTADVYVTGRGSDNVFKITASGLVTEIIDAAGDGTHGLDGPWSIAVDASGNVYVAGTNSSNVFKITPDGAVIEIIDVTQGLIGPSGIAVDGSANVYVTGSNSVFEVTPGGVISVIIDSTGDGVHQLVDPRGLAVDSSGNVYVTGFVSGNAFKITPDGTITQIIDSTGDGTHGLFDLSDIAVDASQNVYVVGTFSDNAFKIKPNGTITQIIDGTGDGTHGLDGPLGIAADAAGNVYVTGFLSDNAFQITPGGTIARIIAGSHGLDAPAGIAAEGSGVVYVAGMGSDNAFRITPPGTALAAIAGLIVPGFEVEVGNPLGPTTFFSVRNTTDEEVLGRVDFFGATATAPLRSDPFILDPQATRPHNVRDDLSGLEIEDGVATGFAVVTEFGGTTAPNLEGDYFRVDFDNDFAAGDRLVRPADFCLMQEIRFVEFGSGSELRILLNRPRGDEVPSFSYIAYDETGTEVANGDFFTSDYLSVLDVGELVQAESFGTVHFDFSSSGGGWVSPKYSAFGRFSLELDAACRDR